MMMSEMVAVCEESALGAPVWCVANGMWAEWGVIRARAVPAGSGGDTCWVVEDWRRVRAGSLVTPDGMPSSTHGGLRTPDALRAALASAANSDADLLLQCPHCGDVAYESPSGLFGDGDGVACMSCGHPGHVSVDEDEKGEAVAYWVLGLGPCDDAQCHACDDERHTEAGQ